MPMGSTVQVCLHYPQFSHIVLLSLTQGVGSVNPALYHSSIHIQWVVRFTVKKASSMSRFPTDHSYKGGPLLSN